MEPLTTMEPFATQLELVELLMRIYTEENLGFKADAVYCYGQERANTISVAKNAAQLLREERVYHIAIPTYGALEKYNWFYGFIRTMLLEADVPEEKIVPIPHPEEFSIAHTHTEAIGLARYAREAGWQIVYVTALPSHMPRASIETVTAVIREYPQLLAYNSVGVTLPWTEQAVHSQGIISGARFAVIESELKKILTYHLKGDLVSAREALDYLNRHAEAILELNRQQEEFFMCPPERRRHLIIGENNKVVGLD